jgi:hypothetical protein
MSESEIVRDGDRAKREGARGEGMRRRLKVDLGFFFPFILGRGRSNTRLFLKTILADRPNPHELSFFFSLYPIKITESPRFSMRISAGQAGYAYPYSFSLKILTALHLQMN